MMYGNKIIIYQFYFEVKPVTAPASIVVIVVIQVNNEVLLTIGASVYLDIMI